MNVLAQVLGVLAIIAWVASILQKEKRNVLICQIVANGIYGIQYFLLGAISASLMNFTSFVRSIVFYDDNKCNRKTTAFSFLFFSLIIIIFGFLTYDGRLSLIPVFITFFYGYALWQENLNITRWIFLIAAFIWIYYNFMVGAYISIAGNILELVSSVVAIKKYRNVDER